MSFNPTDEQRANLAKLADYLDALPADYRCFEMHSYHSDAVYPSSASVPECGTTACAVGHGPAAGFPATRYENWDEYRIRLFGPGSIFVPGAAQYMFSPLNPNDPHAAAGRIRKVLAGEYRA